MAKTRMASCQETQVCYSSYAILEKGWVNNVKNEEASTHGFQSGTSIENTTLLCELSIGYAVLCQEVMDVFRLKPYE